MSSPANLRHREPAAETIISQRLPSHRVNTQSRPPCDSTCALLQYYRSNLSPCSVLSASAEPPLVLGRIYVNEDIQVIDTLSASDLDVFHFDVQAIDPTPAGPPGIVSYGTLTPWQTRLIRLVGFAHHSGLLEVDVFPVEFTDMDGVGITGTSEVVNYVALSHVWGTRHDQTTILCNGQTIAVPCRLKDALCYLHNQTSNRYIWVDELCINQSDTTEKASQVRNMLRIFEKASKVIAWIDTRASLSRYSIFDFTPCNGCKHSQKCSAAWDALCSSLFAIAADELWSRTWCRQEIFAAKELVLLGPYFTVGGLSLTRFHEMLKSCVEFDKSNQLSNDERQELQIPSAFQVMVDHYQHAGTDDYDYEPPATKTRYTNHWLRQLRDGTAFKVTDARDRIYALFGMVSSASNRSHVEHRPDIQSSTFPIGYSKSISRVYQDLVKYLINTDRNLDCLTVLEDRATRSLPDDLPSWVIDWRRHQPRSLLNIPPSRSADHEMYGTPRVQDLDDVGSLKLDGQILFEVKELSAHKPTNFEWLMAYQKTTLKAGLENRPDSPIDKISDSPRAMFGTTDELDNYSSKMNASYMHCKFFMGRPEDQYAIDGEFISVPNTTRIGDLLVLLKGARFPFVFRRLKDRTYHLVGPALNGPVLGSSQSAAIMLLGSTGLLDQPDRVFFKHGNIHWTDEHTETFVVV